MFLIKTLPKAVLLPLLALTALGGCTTWPDRAEINAVEQAAAIIPGLENVRFWADAPGESFQPWRQSLLAQLSAANLQTPATLLAISGGSDKGAFTAGLLKGWSDSGDRPDFTIVTGVSTGALIAPFAFLGSEYDDTLGEIYTGIDSDDIYSLRGLGGFLSGPSLLNSGPLAELIAHHVDVALLDRIAHEHARGRRLLVLTTNLDAQRGVIWDMGAIASSPSPDRIRLFRQVLLASASIPGAFPPVLIDVQGNGTRFSEMHVDGGTTAGFLALPQSVLWSRDDRPTVDDAAIIVLYNGWIEPRFEVVEPRTFPIISRALSTALTEADRFNIADVREFTQRHGFSFTLCAIGNEFEEGDAPLFDQAFMNRLYDYGEASGRDMGACIQEMPDTRAIPENE